MPGFLATKGEFSQGPEMRLDGSELLCNKGLLKYKGDRESFWHRHQKGAELATPHTPTTPAAGTWNNGNFPFHLPTMWENQVQSLGWEDPLEKEMAIHSSILAWRIPRTEEPGGLQSVGLQRVAHDWATPLSLFLSSNLACLLAFEQWVAGHCPSTPHTNSFQ